MRSVCLISALLAFAAVSAAAPVAAGIPSTGIEQPAPQHSPVPEWHESGKPGGEEAKGGDHTNYEPAGIDEEKKPEEEKGVKRRAEPSGVPHPGSWKPTGEGEHPGEGVGEKKEVSSGQSYPSGEGSDEAEHGDKPTKSQSPPPKIGEGEKTPGAHERVKRGESSTDNTPSGGSFGGPHLPKPETKPETQPEGESAGGEGHGESGKPEDYEGGK
ncbi:hypothetical protein ASPZODRAFT_126612 [Penicilliopsis zonata CBS 506.65]|uniref:Uncharacterized protein n=1 Tax=Penicilliopsis zonata CBS 506.65 TaxID=1073090 RepID=A0A1L9SU13_9EURO|nr:hypothetical protein ASPZODRAFT_126612 [Penicilliopsis zonata CBS 506.65]OJJ50689.1 hypothetical protein ASPZODRAFT_126612 [Penicilliopsis zonata CBS 506.65]